MYTAFSCWKSHSTHTHTRNEGNESKIEYEAPEVRPKRLHLSNVCSTAERITPSVCTLTKWQSSATTRSNNNFDEKCALALCPKSSSLSLSPPLARVRWINIINAKRYYKFEASSLQGHCCWRCHRRHCRRSSLAFIVLQVNFSDFKKSATADTRKLAPCIRTNRRTHTHRSAALTKVMSGKCSPSAEVLVEPKYSYTRAIGTR